MEPEEDSFSLRDFAKYFSIGAAIAIGWLLCWVLLGFFWSLYKTDGIRLGDHLFNGWVTATVANLLALIAGTSVGLTALFSINENMKSNSVVAGFVLAHFIIVATLWSVGATKFKKAEKPKPEILMEFKWPFGKQD